MSCFPCEVEAVLRRNQKLIETREKAVTYAKNQKLKEVVIYKTKNGYGYGEWGSPQVERLENIEIIHVD